MTTNPISAEWLTAAVELQGTLHTAGSELIALENFIKTGYDPLSALYAARALRYRLDHLRTEAKQAQAQGHYPNELHKIADALEAVAQQAAATRKRAQEDQ